MTRGSTGLHRQTGRGTTGCSARAMGAWPSGLTVGLWLFLAAAGLWASLAAAQAQEAPDPAAAAVPEAVEAGVDAVLAAVRMDDTIAILRDEGIEYALSLETDMIGRPASSAWAATVAEIYDPARMADAFRAALLQEFAADAAALPEIRAFFEGGTGQRAVALEIDARRAFLDDAVEEQAKVAWEKVQASDPARAALLERFVALNDLVESNVSGGLNANLAFYRGLAESGALDSDLTEDQMLADVWAQEPEVRKSTTDWVYSYLNLAYGPLSEAELTAYADFCATDAGQKANAALFAAYDKVFAPISRALGLAVGRQMQGQDI